MERRTDAQMFGMLLSFAREDSRVRAVWMNGSRANPNAPADRWQDFDIVYAVTEMDSFLSDDSWVDRFGERAMMQTRRDQYDSYGPGETADYSDWFIYLMQFADGNRVDLSLVPAENAAEAVLSDKMCVVLLDKDGLLPPVPPATDEDYRAGLPTPLEFRCSVNEFWWVSGNVDKGLRRGGGFLCPGDAGNRPGGASADADLEGGAPRPLKPRKMRQVSAPLSPGGGLGGLLRDLRPGGLRRYPAGYESRVEPFFPGMPGGGRKGRLPRE